MVDDPINDRHRHVVVVEELAPTGEVLVGGEDAVDASLLQVTTSSGLVDDYA